jgi:hypothetical protein
MSRCIPKVRPPSYTGCRILQQLMAVDFVANFVVSHPISASDSVFTLIRPAADHDQITRRSGNPQGRCGTPPLDTVLSTLLTMA